MDFADVGDVGLHSVWADFAEVRGKARVNVIPSQNVGCWRRQGFADVGDVGLHSA